MADAAKTKATKHHLTTDTHNTPASKKIKRTPTQESPKKPTIGSKDKKTKGNSTKKHIITQPTKESLNTKNKEEIIPLDAPLFPEGVPDLTKHTELQKSLEEKLKSSQFRYINEQLYTMTGSEAKELFDKNPELPVVYHTGYRRQVAQWPLNPLTAIIDRIKKLDEKFTVCDFGCGDAVLAASVPHTVHSFDLYKANDRVTVCEMSHVPLPGNSINVAVFCLSLMGTNFKEYITEANRVLVVGGLLLIAEVRSRLSSLHQFIEFCTEQGFVYDTSNKRDKMFVWLEFHKSGRGYYSSKERAVALLKPCKYKKR